MCYLIKFCKSKLVDLLDNMMPVNINDACDDKTVGIETIALISNEFDVTTSIFGAKLLVNAILSMILLKFLL